MSSPEETVGRLGPRRVVGGWIAALLGPALLTGALLALPRGSALSLETMLFLALAVGCALLGGRWPAVAASVVGTLSLNFFFTPPLHTLDIASGRDVATLVVFLITSLAVAAVVDAAARRRERAARAEREAATLAMLNHTVLGGEYDVPRLLELVGETFGGRAELVEGDELEAVATPSSSTTTVLPAGRTASLVVRGADLDPADRRVLAAFASHLGVLGERAELARQTAAARELEAGNRTRTALLAAVSHDLRTPLAGIRSASETLRRHDDALSGDDRAALLSAIEDSTQRLSTMVSDLLDMSRLQTGAVRPALVPVSLNEVVSRALDGLPDVGGVEVAPLPDALVDPALLERVVANVVANAVRHSDLVQVTGATAGRRVHLCVVDHGPGVDGPGQVTMFEPFQRLGDTDNDSGVGLGLAVARGLTEAQGGSLDVSDTPGGGLTMTLDLAGVDPR